MSTHAARPRRLLILGCGVSLLLLDLPPPHPPPKLLNKKLEADAKKWQPVLPLQSSLCPAVRDRHLGQDLRGAGH